MDRFDASWLSPDPLEFPHRYAEPADREIVGFYASALAYGRVAQIRATLEDLTRRLGPHPATFVRNFDARRDGGVFRGFVHRFHRGRDMILLTAILSRALGDAGSLEEWFLAGDSPAEEDIAVGLSSFCRRSLDVSGLPPGAGVRGGRLAPGAPVRYFFSSPASGSACKRLNLFLRWMVRPNDGLDLGLWTRVAPSRLVIPLDTHIARIATNIGLTARRTPDWKMAVDITERLRELDPEDPIRYDFALCRLGILDYCPRRRDPLKCARCHIQPVCTL